MISRLAILANYPEMTPAERSRLEDGGSVPKDWKMPENLEQRARLRELEVTPSLKNPIREGMQVSFKGTLHYADGRTADVTQDLTWHTPPALSPMLENQLAFGCLHEDQMVTGEFLGERQAQVRLEFRKPLRSLDIRVSESAESIEKSDFQRLRITAVCEDGTTSDVSCQASWTILSKGFESLGCGYLKMSRKTGGRRPITIRASYGDREIERTLDLPPRK